MRVKAVILSYEGGCISLSVGTAFPADFATQNLVSCPGKNSRKHLFSKKEGLIQTTGSNIVKLNLCLQERCFPCTRRANNRQHSSRKCRAINLRQNRSPIRD